MPKPKPGPPQVTKKIVLHISGATQQVLDKYSAEVQKIAQKYQ